MAMTETYAASEPARADVDGLDGAPMQPKPNALCPLCGEPNDCAPARSGSFDTPCWCTTVTIGADVLARIPEAQRNQSCVCRRCAESAATAGGS